MKKCGLFILWRHSSPLHPFLILLPSPLVPRQDLDDVISVPFQICVHRCTVIFKFFWGGTWGCEKSGRGTSIFVFYCMFMLQFFKVFWGGTWGAPPPPLPPPSVCIYVGVVQASTTRFLRVRLQWPSFWWGSLIRGCIITKDIGS